MLYSLLAGGSSGSGPNAIGSFQSRFSSGYNPTANVANDLTRIVSNLLGILTIIAGVSFLIYFVLGAVNWITSGGDSNKAQAARTIIVNAVLGLAITVIAYPAVLVLSSLLGFPLADPGELFGQFQ